MHNQYADWVEKLTASLPYNNGIKAPPATAIISIADPVLVNLPSPVIASGHTAGHTREFANPRSETNNTVTGKTISIGLNVMKSIKEVVKLRSAGTKIAPSEKITPRIVHILKALTWLIYLGMKITPTRYPNLHKPENDPD